MPISNYVVLGYSVGCRLLRLLGAKRFADLIETRVWAGFKLHTVPAGPRLRGRPRATAVKRQHILCYSPYTTFTLHAAWETLLLHALHFRGHETTLVMCDGIFAQCDVFRFGQSKASDCALGPSGEKTPGACRECRRSASVTLTALDTPYLKISQWLRSGEASRARSWAARLAAEELPHAQFGDWPVGPWVASSVHSHFRANALDLSCAGTEAIFRRYAEAGLVACFALDRMLEEQKPDVLLLFNGRMSSTRIALELARRKGIRTVVEERARIPGHIRLIENGNCLSLKDLDRLWAEWKDIPLTHHQVDRITNLLMQRRSGQSFEIKAFSPSEGHPKEIRRELGLDERPIWLLLTSSIDESVLEPRASGLFESQNAWVESVLDYARRNSDIQLIIRVHPNVGSNRSVGRNTGDVEFFRRLATNLPENVRIVQSDQDVSSYTLMAIADTGLIWHSITGLEMACMGKRVLRSGGWFLGGKEFLHPLADGPEFSATLDRAKCRWTRRDAAETARLALRCAFVWYFRQAFPMPLVRQDHWYSGAYDFKDPSQVMPGASPDLDRIATVLLGERPLYLPPGPTDRQRSCQAENAVIDRLVTLFEADAA